MAVIEQWQVYIVQCADGSLYTGCTPDLQNRIATHQAGKGAKYTRSRLPIALVYSEIVTNKSAAFKREAQIKSLTRAEKLKLLSSR